MTAAKQMGAPYDLVLAVAETGKLPVLNFAAGGIATPADAALMMQLGCDGVFVGSGIFKSENPAKMAEAIVQAAKNYDQPGVLLEISRGGWVPPWRAWKSRLYLQKVDFLRDNYEKT